jgi:hypothetical protein
MVWEKHVKDVKQRRTATPRKPEYVLFIGGDSSSFIQCSFVE